MSRHGHKEIERIKQLAAKMNTASLPLTQQELNVKFAKALGWKLKRCEHHKTNTWHSPEGICADGNSESVLSNYFAPENFHLVRAAVEQLNTQEFAQFYTPLKGQVPYTSAEAEIWKFRQMFLSPVEHIITAYLKVKEVNQT